MTPDKNLKNIIYPVLLLLSISCHVPQFLKSDGAKEEQNSQKIKITARISLPAKDNELPPAFDSFLNPSLVWQPEIEFEENFSERADYSFENFDELTDSLRLDWDENLDNLYSDKAISVMSMETSGNLTFRAILPTARYGLIDFSMDKGIYEANFSVLLLGTPDKPVYHRFIEKPDKNIVDIRAEFAYAIFTKVIFPNKNENFGSLAIDNRLKINQLFTRLEETLAKVSYSDTATNFMEERQAFSKELFNKSLYPELYTVIKENTILSDNAIDEIVKNSFGTGKSTGNTTGQNNSGTDTSHPTVTETSPKWIFVKGSENLEVELQFEDSTKNFIIPLSDFEMSETEITLAQYNSCVKAQKCKIPEGSEGTFQQQVAENPDFPVAYVSWDEAREYCHFTNGEIPSLAQWYMAATSGKGYNYPWGNEWKEKMAICDDNSCKDGIDGCARVGIFSPTEAGIFDLAGNAGEWLLDSNYNFCWKHSKELTKIKDFVCLNKTDTSPVNDGTKIIQGGTCSADGSFLLNKIIKHDQSGYIPYRSSGIGIRCVRQIQ